MGPCYSSSMVYRYTPTPYSNYQGPFTSWRPVRSFARLAGEPSGAQRQIRDLELGRALVWTSGYYHNPTVPPFYGLQRNIIRSLYRVKVECRGFGSFGF